MVKRLISTYFEEGIVKSFKKGPVSNEPVNSIAGGREGVSILTITSAEKPRSKEGSKVHAPIKAS